jgi:hypothetical protein
MRAFAGKKPAGEDGKEHRDLALFFERYLR